MTQQCFGVNEVFGIGRSYDSLGWAIAVRQSNDVDFRRNGDHVVAQRTRQGVDVWSHLGRNDYMRLHLRKTATPAARYSCYDRRWTKVFSVYGVCYSPWGNPSVSFGEVNTASTGRAFSHVTGRARQWTTTGGFIEATINVPDGADVWLAYTRRTGGTYARIDINGDPLAANELPSTGVFRYLDTYGPVDSTRQQITKIASGLSSGAHTFRITKVADANGASSSANGITIEALLIDAKVGSANWQPPAFPLGTDVLRGDEFRGSNGYIYSCTDAGTTDASNEPTHSSSTAVNGTATFLAFSTSTWGVYGTSETFPSELELAIEATVDSTKEDFGGQTHGGAAGEAIVAATEWRVDGAVVDVAGFDQWEITDLSSSITLEESIDWVHSKAAELATHTLRREFVHGKYLVAGTIGWHTTAQVGYAYPAMLPFVRYSGRDRADIVDTVTPAGGDTIVMEDYVSQSNPVVQCGKTYGVKLAGSAYAQKTGEPCVSHALCWPFTVDEYRATAAQAFVQLNREAADGTGSTDWQAKFYFERVDSGNLVNVVPGSEWHTRCEYRWAMA